MVALGMDGFHQTRKLLMARPDAAEALARRGAPWTFDPEALAARLIRLREAKGTEPVPWPDFEHAVGDPVENAIWVPAVARIVLVEGLYLLHPADGWDAVNSQFDEVWYLDTPLEVALERLTLRHMAAWNLSREQAEARVAANDRLNAEMVATGRDRAQILIRD